MRKDPFVHGLIVALLLGATAGGAAAGTPPTSCSQLTGPATAVFPRIEFCAFPGVRSSTGEDSTVARKVTLRWVRDRAAEARPDFGGYRIYRQSSVRDTTNMELLRRFAVQTRSVADTLANGQPNTSTYSRRDTLLWHFPDNQEVLEFVDPDSAGNLVKVCRDQIVDGICDTPGDSVFVLVPPGQPPLRPDLGAAGPHEGFALYYTIVYGVVDQTRREVAEMFVPDTLSAACVGGNPLTCPNLNGKATNLMTSPVYVSGPARPNVESVVVVPNPYRGHERWDEPGRQRIQFQHLPARATVSVFTVGGDLVRVLEKSDPLSGNLDWDLKNADGRDITSGIYLFHVQSEQGFEAKGNFVVIL